MAVLHPGITPAWAGKSNCRFTFFVVWEDHPRVGGEKGMQRALLCTLRGSPPRGRGKAYIFPTFWGVERITPAWAGKRHFCNPGFECHGDHPRVGGEKTMQLIEQGVL